MNRLIYSTLFCLAMPVLMLRLLWRSRREPAYRKRWRERFALYGSDSKAEPVDVAFHAVSVGEVHATVPLIENLRQHDPALRILVTTTTPTGSSRVRALLADKVRHVYLPYDTPGAVKRFLRHFTPRVLVIMETEWWPNLLHYCSQEKIRLMLANARLSQKSRDNYTHIGKLAGNMLRQFDKVTAQSAFDSERLRALGLDAEKVEVTGSMKYDMTVDSGLLEQARQDKAALGGRPVLVAASTRTQDGEAEEEKVLQAFARLHATHDDLLLVLVPRHPERFDSVAAMADGAGFNTARRSRDRLASASHQILIGDSMGEMAWYYGLADIAFVGGSLVNTGCQNIIEPAAIGLPVVTGPSLYNFQAVSEQLRAAGAMTVVADAEGLAEAVKTLLDDPGKRRQMGEAAFATAQANRGATGRNLEIIQGLLENLT